MTSNEIRQSFLDYFKNKTHRIVPSAPVVPHGDPTLLFTNAGMNQFKDVFLGTGSREYSRAADTQKCIRVSGKHNDLEEVGVDTYHHTFFEMLGNWSFGDYYKEDAIAWAWELLVDKWKLDSERLYATVFETDDEAFEIWKKYLPESRIQRHGAKDNFWEMGETGPCGPCSEIHYDGTPDKTGGPKVNASDPQVIEIWNLVFIQFNRKSDGALEPLSSTHVDTGMGFERIVRVIQGKTSNYDTDVFMPLINKISQLSGRKYNGGLEDKDSIAMRVIADHIRTLSFSIADGAFPGNEGRGYVLRRILRRASRYSRNLGFKEPFLYSLLPVLIETLGDFFPELNSNREIIEKVIKGEEESFLQTLERGLNKFEEIKSNIGGANSISGDEAFLLFDSFGFPLDLTELIARENNLEVDIAGFEVKMKEQKDRSRAARKKTTQEVEIPMLDFSSEFVGYESLSCEGKVLYINENQIVLDKTPFYVESGGQVSDTGKIILGGETYLVEDVKKSGNAIIHFCDKNLENLVGGVAFAQVDSIKRKSTARNHSATHLMHEAIRQTVGTHIKQQGSLVCSDYLRFDFNHFERVTTEQIEQIENIVNKKIFENHLIETIILTLEQASQNDKIRMYFGDKYGDIVRAVVMDEKYSIELCGGTHVKNTSEIGLFKVKSEGSVAAGIRRIEAITGEAIELHIKSLNDKIVQKNNEHDNLNDKIKQLEKEITELKLKELEQSLSNFENDTVEINGINVISKQINTENAEQLKKLCENYKSKVKSNTIVFFTSVNDDKVNLCLAITDDITNKYQAGKIIGEAAKFLGGGGGGKPNFATAGGKDISKVSELLNSKFKLIIEAI
ncbi:MAG: alanine--tRNA ligase [Candidatus Kapabacteria bacterium]|nr:alanine--tRNA ligase [Candidatus Kapabacteria bacterium]